MNAIGVIFAAFFGLLALMGLGGLPLALSASHGFERRETWRALGYIVLGTVGLLFFSLTV
jgi:hypothetical protein